MASFIYKYTFPDSKILNKEVLNGIILFRDIRGPLVKNLLYKMKSKFLTEIKGEETFLQGSDIYILFLFLQF